jgi:hypothetical protein
LVPELTWRIGKVSDRAALRLLRLADEGTVDIGHFQMFAYGDIARDLSEDVFRKWTEFLLSHPNVRATYIALALYSRYYLGKESRHSLPEELTLRVLTNPSLFEKSEVVRQDQMASYHWELLGKAFVRLYPTRSLELADTMLEHFGETGTILEGFHSTTQSVLVEITCQYPEEIWARITEYLAPPRGRQAFTIQQWLRGEDHFGEEREGALSLIPMDAVWQWVDGDVENRAWYLANLVPKVIFRREDRACWAREVLVRYGERKDVRRNLAANFSTEGWTGSESLHLQNKRQRLLDFREGEGNENVRLWIDEYASELARRIERAKVVEEREDF